MFDASDADNFVVVVDVVVLWCALLILSAYGLNILNEIVLAIVRVLFGGVSGLVLLLGHVVEMEVEKYFGLSIEFNTTRSTSSMSR